jgi:hypothetical protein
VSEPVPVHELDAEQEFQPATPYQVRDELQDLIARDLLGPWDGDLEVLPEKVPGPGDRYLVGRLGPKRARDNNDSSGTDADIAAAGDGQDPELPDKLTIQDAGRMWASSMGLSCQVAEDVTELKVTAQWGRYRKADVLDDAGNRKSRWSREPVSIDTRITLNEPSRKYPLNNHGAYLNVEVRDRVVEITLVNEQEEPAVNRDTAWLFQPKLIATATDESPVFCPIDDPDETDFYGDAEDKHLRLLYRDALKHAAGRNVATHASVRLGDRKAYKIETEWLPVYEVPPTIAPSDLPGEFAMRELAEASQNDLAGLLTPLATGYEDWLKGQEDSIPELAPHLRATAETAIFKARACAARIRAGIELLAADEPAYRAFSFANHAMLLQRQHTTIAGLRDEMGYDQAREEVDQQGDKVATWRPFQLAFVLLNLKALTDPASSERDIVDLLFFPTGGGKTEAYLGLAAYTFAIRRLQREPGGVGVLMRYTLRLLTAQQFQRAAALVCAAEVLRREAEPTWGGEPFRIGLWVGGAVTPNWYEQAAQQIKDVRDSPKTARTGILQTLACPWCGTKLEPHRDLRPDEDRRRVLLLCPSYEEGCPFSSGEGLPILTVDEEVYRLLPAFVIATVDKLAQLPWHGYAGMLFGRVSRRCPRHGYQHFDLAQRTGCTGRHNATPSGLEAVASQPVARLRPPDLIIQDELHLISGALGTTVGLFEAAVDELCRRPEGGPKIIASTATTKRAAGQVRGIFARDLEVFPPAVMDISNTYFSETVPVSGEHPGRRYLGVCAHGIRLKSAEIRLAEILLLAGQTLFDRYGAVADPYMTLVGYFNATRELAGMRRYLDDDVTTRVRRNGRARGISDRIATGSGMLAIEELTSRISSADISAVLKRLENGFDPELDTLSRRKAAAAEFGLSRREKREPHPLAARAFRRENPPVDVVLATSMLQVGVDVSRFGLMVVTGQPKNTAEYIQASSRVGRSSAGPGLVVTLYNWSRPRDLAHYEDFECYHATYYRQVEALSVTPYTRRALDRGTASTFVAAVRNATEPYSVDAAAQDVDLSGEAVTGVRSRMLARAEKASDLRGREYLGERLDALTDEWERAKTGSTRLGYRSRRGKQPLNGLLKTAGSGSWSTLTVPMSMRETENEINLLVPGADLFSPLLGAPPWVFTPPDADGEPEDEDETPEADEVGGS